MNIKINLLLLFIAGFQLLMSQESSENSRFQRKMRHSLDSFRLDEEVVSADDGSVHSFRSFDLDIEEDQKGDEFPGAASAPAPTGIELSPKLKKSKSAPTLRDLSCAPEKDTKGLLTQAPLKSMSASRVIGRGGLPDLVFGDGVLGHAPRLRLPGVPDCDHPGGEGPDIFGVRRRRVPAGSALRLPLATETKIE